MRNRKEKLTKENGRENGDVEVVFEGEIRGVGRRREIERSEWTSAG